jgi:hypothetical protein
MSVFALIHSNPGKCIKAGYDSLFRLKPSIIGGEIRPKFFSVDGSI